MSERNFPQGEKKKPDNEDVVGLFVWCRLSESN